MKAEITEGMKYSLQQITGYLKARGIPKQMIDQIRMSLTYDAVTQSKDIQYDRIYTGIGLMLRKEYGFGRERILRGLKCFDDTVGSVLDPDKDWTTVMDELRDDVGIIIRSGDENRLVIECLTEEERKNYKYGSAETETKASEDCNADAGC